MPDSIDTNHMRIEFGKYKGELVTRLPINYLEWHINIGSTFAEIAQAELDRRGISKERTRVKISRHAIDRASLRALEHWYAQRQKNEGLYSWLVRISWETICKQESIPTEGRFKAKYGKLILVFNSGKLYPTLVTVIKK